MDNKIVLDIKQIKTESSKLLESFDEVASVNAYFFLKNLSSGDDNNNPIISTSSNKPEDISLEMLEKSYSQHLETSGSAKSTVDSYSNEVKRFCNFIKENKIHLNLLSQNDINTYLANSKSGRNLSPNSYSKLVVVIRSFAAYLYKNGYINKDIASDLKVPRRVDRESSIRLFTGTTVTQIQKPESGFQIIGYSAANGITRFNCRAVILAMGCRERNRGNIHIPGSRPAGIFTAGLAQRLVNIEGYLPGCDAVIIGSGDIGLIMARRMRWVGAHVHGVVEIQPYPSGLTRNIVQCLNDFSIPLHLSHVVTKIIGRDRVEAVEISPLERGVPDSRGRFTIACDTVLLSVGLIPENELSRSFGVAMNRETGGPFVDASLMTSNPGVFACGNVLHVHDLVDYACEEAERCAAGVADFLDGDVGGGDDKVRAGANVRYVVPGSYRIGRDNVFYLRSLIVKNDVELVVRRGEDELYKRRISHVQPSEMVRLSLPADRLKADNRSETGKIEVSLQ